MEDDLSAQAGVRIRRKYVQPIRHSLNASSVLSLSLFSSWELELACFLPVVGWTVLPKISGPPSQQL